MRRILKNEYFFSIITRFLTLGLSLLQSVYLARFLGTALQGASSYIYSITGITGVVLTFGIHQAYPFFRKKRGREKVFDRYLSIITVLFAFYCGIILLITLLVKTDSEVKFALVFTPFIMLATILEYVALIEDPNKRNRSWTWIYAIQVLFIIIMNYSIKANYTIMLLIIIIPVVVRIIVFYRQLHFCFVFDKESIHFVIELFKFGFFPMIALLMTTLNYKIDILMLGQYKSITRSMIGVYSIGMDFADKIALIPDTLKGVLVSKLSKGADEKEVAKVCCLCFWASIIICLGIIVLGESVITWLYGKDYAGAYDVLLICSGGVVFVGFFKLIAQYNIIQKRQIRNIVLLSGSIIINIILNLLLIPRYQLKGAAIASGIGYFLTGIIFVFWFAKTNHIPFHQMFIPPKKDIQSVVMRLKGENQ